MAGEKTEKATPKKQAEARDKGEVAKSQDLSGAAVLFAGLMTLGAFGPKIIQSLEDMLTSNLEAAADPRVMDGSGPSKMIIDAMQVTGVAIAPIMVACAVAAAVILVVQVGFKITPKAIKPQFKRMNPISNAKQTFGPNALVELVKNLAKVSAVGIVVAMIIIPQVKEVGTLVGMEPVALGNRLLASIMQLAKWAAAAYFIIGVADWVWQKHKMAKGQKMALQEVKDEYKQGDLPAEVKMAIKQRQRAMSRARQMAAIPDADVVVTNPTHYSVALKYDPETAAPIVVAKGKDLVAKNIRELAAEHGVPVIPDPPLARALHAAVEVGDIIPEEMYEAVAAVLAFVYRTAADRGSMGRAA